jgi:hypothetical protein
VGPQRHAVVLVRNDSREHNQGDSQRKLDKRVQFESGLLCGEVLENSLHVKFFSEVLQLHSQEKHQKDHEPNRNAARNLEQSHVSAPINNLGFSNLVNCDCQLTKPLALFKLKKRLKFLQLVSQSAISLLPLALHVNGLPRLCCSLHGK